MTLQTKWLVETGVTEIFLVAAVKREIERKKTEIEKTSRALYKSDCCLCKQIGHFLVYASMVCHAFLRLYVLISVESHYFFFFALCLSLCRIHLRENARARERKRLIAR